MKRTLRPRATSALAIAPLLVTDLTAPVAAGLEPRAFREFVVRAGIPHVRDGHRVIVRADVLLAAIDRLARSGASATESAPASSAEEDEPSADELLRRIGRFRTGGAR